MNTRWKVRRYEGLWRVWNSMGDWDSDYADWAAAVHWASSPFHRAQFYANYPEGV